MGNMVQKELEMRHGCRGTLKALSFVIDRSISVFELQPHAGRAKPGRNRTQRTDSANRVLNKQRSWPAFNR